MKKLMVLTLGTGKGVENGIAKSITVNNPDRIVFIATPQSQEMLEKIADALERLYHRALPPFDIKPLSQEMVVDYAYRAAREAIDAALQEGYALEEIVLDFTSGTKAMSVGAAVAALLAECYNMVYIGGYERDAQGRVITGTEIVMSFTPNRIFGDYKKQLALRMFDAYQFDAGLSILQEARRRGERDDLTQLDVLFRAYERWDKFDHVAALRHFEHPDLPRDLRKRIGGNRGFVSRIVNAASESPAIAPELLADLLANARRRMDEGKDDDAVARLYRLTEMIAQYRLQQKGVNASDVVVSALPDAIRPVYDALRGDSGKIKLGLTQAFRLLGELGDEAFLPQYARYEALRGLLKQRNDSILAHGIRPVGREIPRLLIERLDPLLRETVPQIHRLLDDATMIKLT
ncbi:CRISPR-associated protein Cas02710 [Candidatus Moduliflexus flocculans]|uniref:CRISPR-associated protein Cas02710 n=1 Tax=Candidatus Moduliflexus flocculans TaxID=1499966 RepID=A0A081BLD8_9BACT|nr:CRISPR-associated protein Cas02710 [Candidatus Moduliflexus flocculans]